MQKYGFSPTVFSCISSIYDSALTRGNTCQWKPFSLQIFMKDQLIKWLYIIHEAREESVYMLLDSFSVSLRNISWKYCTRFLKKRKSNISKTIFCYVARTVPSVTTEKCCEILLICLNFASNIKQIQVVFVIFWN